MKESLKVYHFGTTLVAHDYGVHWACHEQVSITPTLTSDPRCVFLQGRKQEAKYSAMKSICRRFSINIIEHSDAWVISCRSYFSMCKQLLVLSEGTVQQSKVRKVSSFDDGRQIIFTSPTILFTILRLEHALAKLDIVIWENVLTSGFSQVSLMSRRRPNPNPRVNYNESTRSTWSAEQGNFANLLVSTIYYFINRVWSHLCEG